MHFFQKMLQIEQCMSRIKNSILGIKNPCLRPLFKPISFLKKFWTKTCIFGFYIFYAIFGKCTNILVRNNCPLLGFCVEKRVEIGGNLLRTLGYIGNEASTSLNFSERMWQYIRLQIIKLWWLATYIHLSVK